MTDSTKTNLLFFIILSLNSVSTVALSGAIAGKIATKYIPTIISSNISYSDEIPANTITLPQFYPSQMYIYKNNISSQKLSTQNLLKPVITTPVHNYIKNNITLPSSDNTALHDVITLPDNNEYHIDTDLLSDKDIESFKQKFNDETDAFIAKLSEFWTLMKDQYEEFAHDSNNLHQNNSITQPSTQTTMITRDQAIMYIEQTTEQIFDPHDQQPLSMYIAKIKTFGNYLDPEHDKIIINAIDFLQKNQHRTSIWDTMFWKNAVEEEGLNKIPKSLKLKEIPNTTMLATITTKANLKKND